MIQTLKFAARMSRVKNSRIREILKVTERPGREAGSPRKIISFAGGLPDPELLPTAEIAAAAERSLTRYGSAVLQYSVSEGAPELRDWIRDRYRRRHGLRVAPEEILITNGSQQALDLIGKVFLEEGDPVYVERPSYLGALQSFAMFQPELCGVRMDESGTDVVDLGERVAGGGPGLFYSVPNFQNPTGVTCALERREEIVRIARRAGLLPVEDDPYGELRYSGEDLPSLRALGAETILLGSFSKIVAPGLRVGWVCARDPIMRRLIAAKQAADLHTNVLTQYILVEYLRENDLDAHLARLRERYRARRDAMAAALAQHLPRIRFRLPEGGMFLWCELGEEYGDAGAPAEQLCDAAPDAGIALVPGTPFYPNGAGGDRRLRMNFTNAGVADIETGVLRMSELLQRFSDQPALA